MRDPKQFADIVVARRGGLPLTLGDLGTLVEREHEPDSLARINGQPAINFNVFKQQDANIVATGDARQGGDGRGAQDAAAGRRADARLRRQRLRQGLARRACSTR